MTTSLQSVLPVEIETAAPARAEQRLLLRGVSSVTAQDVTDLITASQSLPAYRWQRRVREYARRLNS